tara:strand:- start:1012 stop:1248 length:237 start_codon:yes stop_codon:yes gene_type:complete
MDKFKIVPDWRELGKVIRLTLMVMGFGFLSAILFITCTDETYIMGYNKDMETIHQQMFEVDSLIMRIQMDLDSLYEGN